MAYYSSSTPPIPLKWAGYCSHDSEIRKEVLNVLPRSPDFMNPTERFYAIPGNTLDYWDSDKEHTSDSNTDLNSDIQTTSKSSAELIEEIAVLEDEIMHMEKYILSLYRNTFHRLQWMTQVKNVEDMDASSYLASSGYPSSMSKVGIPRDNSNPCSSTRGLADPEGLISAAPSIFSSRKEKQMVTHQHNSFADHHGHSQIEDTLVRPDKLSVDIMHCMSSIYCKLTNPTLSNKGCSASSTSSFCSSNTFSSKNLSGHWSPQYSEEVTGNCEFESLKPENGQSDADVEVLKICLDDKNYSYAATMLNNFRSLVKDLEIVDPMKMNREQKLAFWINIHNALLMHAYLAYGTQNYIKSSCIVKASYMVGGHCVNAYDIQSSILGIRSHYSSSWWQTLVSPGKKFKTGNTKHPYAIDYPEPLVHFALCSGSYWDPVVRIYTAKTVFEDLEVARAEFIQSTVFLHNGTKIYLPKTMWYYAKDTSLNVSGLLEFISEYVSDTHRKAIRACVQGGKPSKQVRWLDHNSSFRFLIHKK